MSGTSKRAASDGTISFQAIYRDPSGKKRSAGTFPSRRQATAEGRRAESRVESGVWIDRTSGRTTRNDYVEKVWWPCRQLEVSTRAGYRSYLDKHFLPFFGDIPMAEILPSTVQAWITKAVGSGLAPRSVVKYHVMLHGIFKRAVRDRDIAYNPCADSELPKVITKKQRSSRPPSSNVSWRASRRALLPLSSPRSRPGDGASSSRYVPGTSTSCAARSASKRRSSRCRRRSPRPAIG